MNAPQRLVVILGPTASGKSALAISLARRLAGEIISCDSTQVYRNFDIGTGKVPRAQQQGIPHHLVDLVEPEEVFTAGEYRRRALDTLEGICSRKKLPIITAGTGLYLRALLVGLADAPTRSEELRARLRDRASRRGPEHLHSMLKRLDSKTASRIAPRDAQKVIRAIEICLLAGEPASDLHDRGRVGLEGYQAVKIGLSPPRAALYARIDLRVKAMLDAGWLEEVKHLMERGIPSTAKPFSFIGYSQLRTHVESGLSMEEAITEIQQATRRYAKRQITWFRREADVRWMEGFGDDPKVAEEAYDWLSTDAARRHTV